MQSTVFADTTTVGKDLLDRAIVEDPRMIDAGTIFATRFPADRGGPLKWVDLIGISKDLFGSNFFRG
jgi:hypothetical protein